MLNTIPPDPDRERRDIEHLMEYLRVSTDGPSGLSREEAMAKYIKEVMPTAVPPPKSLPCANVKVEAYEACDKPGTRACSACKLVSYCSKECQRAHWKKHKIDCNNTMRSDKWMPVWRREGRRPSFITDSEEEKSLELGEFNGGTTLWGNMPAIDLINLKDNEDDAGRDFSLAFFASGDLRHVIKTINSLPSDYSGHLDILINDGTPFVACRNLVLMLILGSIPDETTAVDVALHFWYSAFWPTDYRFKIASVVMEFTDHIDTSTGPFRIGGGRSSLQAGRFDKEMFGGLLMHYTSPPSQGLSNEDAQVEYDRVRSAPARHDFRDRMYACLKPSHRVAFYEYRRFGIVLPFGAANAHFNSANASLFNFDGRWLQTDYSDPLEGWNLNEVVERGKAYGAQPEDIYGCLYFFLSEQLQTFYRRIRQFPIAFKMFNEEATKLSALVQDGSLAEFGLPASARFDRIEVSNILDFNYVGLEKTLTHLGPLLAPTDDAVIVGYFMNWFMKQKDGRATGAGEEVMKRSIDRMLSRTKASFQTTVATLGSVETAMISLIQDIDIVYDNSKPFSDFLRKQGVKSILQKTGLTLRDVHRIVPHRLMVPLNASAAKLPEFPSEESCYYHTKLTSMSWAERYVEFARKD